MDFYEDIIQPVGGFCIFCLICGGIYKSCSDSDEPTYSTTPSIDKYDDDLSDSPSPTKSEDPSPREVWEDEWVECITCHGSGDCSICDGEGVWRIGESVYKCGGCYAGKCSACGGKGGSYVPQRHYEYD